jgi:hypothetical protein
LRELNKQLQEITLDLTDSNRKTLETYQGKQDDKLREELKGVRDRLMEELPAARKVGGATLAVAIQDLVYLNMGASTFGLPVKTSDLIALAEEADKAAPSLGTRRLLIAVRLFRAHQALVKQEPAYAKMAKLGNRSLGPSYLIAVALSRPGPAQKACLANADVQAVVKLMLKKKEQFPDDYDEWSWAMLRTAHPKEADWHAKKVRESELYRLDRAIGLRTSPLNAAMAYREHWARLMAGEKTEAWAVLETLAKAGVPLPVK